MKSLLGRCIALCCAVTLVVCVAAYAQEKKSDAKPGDKKPEATKPDAKKPEAGKPGDKAAAGPTAEEIKMMEEMGKIGPNHKLLGEMVGEWNYTIECWWNPEGAPTKSTGTAVTKSLMDGRYFQEECSGKFQMPGADGKMTEKDFKGIGIMGFDNIKQKFFSTWYDNFSTGCQTSEGTYDPSTKTFTYTGECAMAPGMVSKTRTVVKVTDKDKHTVEMYESMAGQPEHKTIAISYTRKPAK